jgi:class 3 adenylate cyclase/tetratricopeptide (TPR) repeat protein
MTTVPMMSAAADLSPSDSGTLSICPGEIAIPLHRYVPDALWRSLAAAGDTTPVPRAVPQQGAALFVDISGFTKVAAETSLAGPEGIEYLASGLNRYLGALVDLVHRHGGDVQCFAGDALLAVWPTSHDRASLPRQVARASACALETQRSLASFEVTPGVEVRLRAAISAGDAPLLHLGGVGGRWLFCVAGDAVRQIGATLPKVRTGEVVLSQAAVVAAAPALRLDGLVTGEAVLLEVLEPMGPVARTPPRSDDSRRDRVAQFVPERVKIWEGHGTERWLLELREVTALFVQLPNFEAERAGALGELDAAVRAIQLQVLRHGGAVDKISVDDKGAVMLCAWGLPTHAHVDDTERAVEAAMGIHRVLGRLGAPRSIGVGSGAAWCGVLGNGDRSEYTILGAPVNRASRLMSVADGTVRCDERTMFAARGRVRFKRLWPEDLKGFSEPVAVFEPVELIARGGAGEVGFIGRDSERTRLSEGIQRLRTGAVPEQIAIGGAPGSGRTRLAQVVHELAVASGVRALRVEGAASQYKVAYQPLAGLVRTLIDVDNESTSDLTVSELVRSWAGRPNAQLVPLLNDILDLGLAETEAIRALDVQARAENLHGLVGDLLSAAATARPTAIIIDDVDALDSASLNLLLSLVLRRTGAWFVLTTAMEVRPEVEHFLAKVAEARLDLGPLSVDAQCLLAGRLLGAHGLSSALMAWIAERSDGNPLVVEQLCASLLASGAVKVEAGHCTYDPLKVHELALPSTLHGLVASRLERLSLPHQHLLKVAAVCGRAFPFALLEAMMAADGEETPLRPQIQQLVQSGVLGLDMDDAATPVRFLHALVHEVVYGHLLFAHRREVHRRVLEWYRRTDAVVDDALVAWHCCRAEDWEAAVAALGRAGRRAIERAAHAEGIEHLRQALEISSMHGVAVAPEQLASWHGYVTDALFRLGDRDGCADHAYQAMRLAGHPMPVGTVGTVLAALRLAIGRLMPAWNPSPLLQGVARERRRELLRVQNRLTEVAVYRQDALIVVVSALRELSLGQAVGPGADLARASMTMGLMLSLSGLHKAGIRWADHALALADVAHDQSVQSFVAGRAAIPYLVVADWVRAEVLARRSLALARQLGDNRLIAENVAILANIRAFQGDYRECLDLYGGLHELARASGDQQAAQWSAAGRGVALLRMGLAADAALLLGVHDPEVFERLKGDPEAVPFWGVPALCAVRLGQDALALRLIDHMLLVVEGARQVAYWFSESYACLADATLELLERAAPAERASALGRAKRAVRVMLRARKAFPFNAPTHALVSARLMVLQGDARRGGDAMRSTLQLAGVMGTRQVEAAAREQLAHLAPDAPESGTLRAAAASYRNQLIDRGDTDGSDSSGSRRSRGAPAV